MKLPTKNNYDESNEIQMVVVFPGMESPVFGEVVLPPRVRKMEVAPVPAAEMKARFRKAEEKVLVAQCRIRHVR